MRISEALALKNEDVNLEENWLLIRDNKSETFLPDCWFRNGMEEPIMGWVA